MKIDPPIEPVQPIADEPAPPVTPIPSRTQPEETPVTSDLGSWASPAFFQRSSASFGNIAHSRLDPFAEEDGFVPGKGRKRPRFSMRSSEWRLIDEPAGPDEKGSPVDWTEELEDEDVEPEPEIDGEGATEAIEAPQETAVSAGPSPSAGAFPGGMGVEDATITVNQPTPEPSADVEQPVETHATRIAQVAREAQVSVNGSHLLVDTPLLLPIPSPGLPVPSPLVSADNRQGYFPSTAQPSALQQNTMVTQYETTGDEHDAISETRIETTQTETVGVPAPERTDEGASISAHESATRKEDTREGLAPPVTTGPVESMVEDEIQSGGRDKTATTRDHQDNLCPPLTRKTLIEDHADIERITSESPAEVEMDEDEVLNAEQAAIDSQEDYEEYEKEEEEREKEQEAKYGEGNSQQEESDEENDMEEVEDEDNDDDDEVEEQEELEERANEAVNVPSDHTHRETGAADRVESPDKTIQWQAKAYSKLEHGQSYYVDEEEDEEDASEDEDEEMDDEEASEGEYELEHVYDDEDVADSEMESDVDGYEQDQAPPAQKSAQPEVIVLDSDDEDEQPDASSQAPPPAHPTREQAEAYASDQEPSDDESRAEQEEEDLSSEEQEQVEDENESMAEGDYDDEGHYIVHEDEDEEEAVGDDRQGHYVEDGEEDEDDYSEEEEEAAEEGSIKEDEQGHYVEDTEEEDDDNGQDEETPAEGQSVREDEDIEGRIDHVEMVEQTRQAEDERAEREPVRDEQERRSPSGDEQERGEQEVEVTALAEHDTPTRPDHEGPFAEIHDEEAHMTESLLQHSEQEPHEHDAPATHPAPSEMAVEAVPSQSETGPEETISSGMQETTEETSEVRLEDSTTELDQNKDSGLWYDGASSLRAAHDNTAITTETFEPSDLSLHGQRVTADDTVETEYSHQISVDHNVNEKLVTSQEHASSRGQDEVSAAQDEAMVEVSVAEAGDILSTTEHVPRSRSASVSQHEWAEANEYIAGEDVLPTMEQELRSRSTSVSEEYEWAEADEYGADEDIQTQEAVDEESSLQLQGEARIRESIEDSDSYTQHPAGPDRRYPGLRSKLSYFAPLATLVDHFNTLTDTISVVSEASSIIHSASGKKDYSLTVYLTDPSMAGTTLTAQIFRPYLEALPSVSNGDIILLRNFKVKPFNHSMMLVSVDTSAWAVFSSSNLQDEAQMTGPQVEYGDEERTHAVYLRGWYQEDGAAMVADNQLQASIVEASRDMTPLSSVGASDTASLDFDSAREGRRDSGRRERRGRKSHRRITIHELRDGRKYTEVGSPSDRESIHELRDGTLYTHL